MTGPRITGASQPDEMLIETSPTLYAADIGLARFERSSIKAIAGYTIESGILLEPDKQVGSLVIVRANDGSLTILVERPDKSGLLRVSHQGKRTFTPDKPYDFTRRDAIECFNHPWVAVIPATTATDEIKIIKLLVGFSRAAADQVGDPYSYALAQVETVNLALRNSRVEDVLLSLVGLQIIEENPLLSSDFLSAMPHTFYRGIQHLDPDLVSAFLHDSSDGYAGWGSIRGRYSAQVTQYNTSFRHEIGHNAGGQHCNDGTGSYNHGYNNGKSSTCMCGNTVPYYSTPGLLDQHGLPLGNAETADMARVWRENAVRMSSYAPPLVGERLILATTADEGTATLVISASQEHGWAGIVALSAVQGPTQLEIDPVGEFTWLTIKVQDNQGPEYDVRLRTWNSKGKCPKGPMNR